MNTINNKSFFAKLFFEPDPKPTIKDLKKIKNKYEIF